MSVQDLIDKLKERERQTQQEEKPTDLISQIGTGLSNVANSPIGKAAIGAGAGYLTAGALPAILGGGTVAAAGPVTAAGVGATANIGLPAAIGAGLAPNAGNVMSAVKGGLDAASAKTPEEAIIQGVKVGAQPTIQAGETAAMGKMGMTPATAKVGDVNYKAGLNVPAPKGYLRDPATGRLFRDPSVPQAREFKPPTSTSAKSKGGMTEPAAKNRVQLFLASAGGSKYMSAVQDDASKNGWLSAYNKLKAKGIVN